MRVCVVGAGGREHALADALARTADVVVTPGNPGIPGSTDTPVEEIGADLYVVGPEAPLVDGLADRLRAAGRLVFGPGADGARLEGSKAWMKEVLVSAGVPTARHAFFRGGDAGPAIEFLKSLPGPYVVKTDGLAAGKGVLVTGELSEAVDDVRAKLAGGVVIEEALDGPEVSLLCLCDGRRVAPLASAQDYKRVGDGDAGPNTGGMGAHSPVPAVDEDEGRRLAALLVEPTLAELRRGIDYRGVLYAGLMLTADGPKVLEYNVRFGDPETQVVLPRLEGDVAALLAEAAAGALTTVPSFRSDVAVTVVGAAEGYPTAARAGDTIEGIEDAAAVEGVRVFCAGVRAAADGRLVTAGGRVLAVTALGRHHAAARSSAYEAIGRIRWDGLQYRTDIAENVRVISRYELPEMAAIFADEARMARWLEIELLATEAWAALGVVPAEDAAACRARAPVVDGAFVAAVDDRERTTDHDVAAFVDVVQDRIGGAAGKWIHYGLTSSDVVDTALCWVLRDAADLMIAASAALIEVLREMAVRYRDTPMVGRTHGVHAEPTTFGRKTALWCLQADRDRARLRAARAGIAVGKLSGAVGTYSNVDPAVERHVCAALGLRPVPATQVIARDRHAEYLWAGAAAGATVEVVALELRHLQRTEVREVEEGFRPGQKGSSAMPHKRNPITAERLCGLARILRGNLQAGLEDVALWHERDISHSSVERVILPDSSLLAYYMLRRCTTLLSGLRVDPERMLANLWTSHGLVFSQPVLLALVAGGLPRDEAYRVVQENASRAWEDGVPFRSLLEKDPRVTLPVEALDTAFDLTRSLRNAGAVFDALEAVDA